jgi:CBS domain-containing protein
VKIAEIIESPSAITIRDDDTLSLALQTMLWSDVRHLPVMRESKVVGVLSERDVLAHTARRGHAGRGDQVHTVMSRPPVTIAPDRDVAEATHLVLERRIGCLPVVDGDRLVGIVTRTDLLRRFERDASRPAERTRPRLAEIMRTDVVTAQATDYLLDCIPRMERAGIRHLPVVDGDRRVVGMLSDRDVRAAIGQTLRPLDRRDALVRLESTRVGDVMSRRPLTLEDTASVTDVASFLADHRIGALPIVDATGRLRGIVSYVDVLKLVAA